MAQEFNSNMRDIFIFLGPSLSREEAQCILPQACYLPPVKCGDIVQIMRFNPKIIGIIDGFFEKTAAVWHKEILFALENGVQVIGGSSMGALRASELHHFGMEAAGSIAEDYINGTLNDDDEVAVLHSAKQSHYLPLTDAMINIRSTLVCAVHEKIIDHSTAAIILNTAKQLFYQERTLEKAIAASNIKTALLQQWLKDKGYQHTKKDDAILVLKTIADKNCSQHTPIKAIPIKMHKPAFFRSLHKNMLCRPFSRYEAWLPLDEKIALASRYLGSVYRLTRRLAYILADCYGLACAQSIQAKTPLAKIAILLETNHVSHTHTLTVKDYLLILMRLSGDYQQHSLLEQQDPLKHQVMTCFAQYWHLIDSYLLRLNLEPAPQTLQEYSNNFRLTHKLHTPEQLNQWLINHDMDSKSYLNMIAANARLSIFIIQNNMDALRDFTQDENIWWFLEALKLTGVYEAAKNLLANPDKIKILQDNIRQQNPALHSYIQTLDFANETEFNNWPLLIEFRED